MYKPQPWQVEAMRTETGCNPTPYIQKDLQPKPAGHSFYEGMMADDNRNYYGGSL
jgi:hypothetical protein